MKKYKVRYEIFEESNKRFQKSTIYMDHIKGLCNWEMYGPNNRFKLECWNLENGSPVIIQLWPDGKGFSSYTEVTMKNIVELSKNL